VGFGLAARRLVGGTTSVHGRGDTSRLIGYEILAALDKLFPLCASAISVFANLLLALVDKGAYLLLAAIDDGADVLRSLARARPEILGALASS
jgi:hypothetical protein